MLLCTCNHGALSHTQSTDENGVMWCTECGCSEFTALALGDLPSAIKQRAEIFTALKTKYDLGLDEIKYVLGRDW